MESVNTKGKKFILNADEIYRDRQMSNKGFNDDSLEVRSLKNEENSGDATVVKKKRPSNLEDLSHDENLTHDFTEANFTLGDISDSEDIWVFDVPKTMNPKNLRGQTIKLGEKNDFQIENELYETNYVESNDRQQLSFVFNTGKRKRPYKIVNVKPAGCIKMRQKIENPHLDVDLISTEKDSVPFPKNLKIRHPLFGSNYNEKIVYVKK